MNYMPEDSYHHPGQGPYADQNPYSGMNGGPGSVHSSRISLHSNSSNRPRQVRPKKKIVVFQVPCLKKTGSVGRLYFFFFFFFFFFACVTNQFFSFFPL